MWTMTAISAVYSDSTAEEKRYWRRQTLAARRAMPTELRREESAVLCQKIAECPLFINARRIAAFAPMETEPDIWPVIESCWNSGKTIALPRVRAPRQMDFHAVSSRQGLEKGFKDILQPPKNFPIINAEMFDFMIVPAAAVDSRRYRLGYGGGFYDTFMAQLTHATTCAPVFTRQIIRQVPVEPHDLQVDFIFSGGAGGLSG